MIVETCIMTNRILIIIVEIGLEHNMCTASIDTILCQVAEPMHNTF